MSQVKFTDGEKVLCYHGSVIYEAKLLKTQVKDRTIKYYIHYAGWSKNWDEWVGETRVLKFNEENVKLQKETQKKVESATKNTKKTPKAGPKKPDSAFEDSTSRSSTPSKEVASKDSTPRSRGSSVKPSASTATVTNRDMSKSIDEEVVKKKRQRLDTSVSNEGEEKIIKTEITISIPKDLKAHLVDDWHAINSQHKLAELPAKITVEEIVEKYKQHKKTKTSGAGGGKGQSCEDISNGILEYFNVMLGSQLLYKVERMQYADILNKYPDKPMSQIYGAFHLLRLFVKLGAVLSFTTLDKNNIRVLIGHLGEFLKFLEGEKDFFSMSCFSNPQTSEYLRRANQ